MRIHVCGKTFSCICPIQWLAINANSMFCLSKCIKFTVHLLLFCTIDLRPKKCCCYLRTAASVPLKPLARASFMPVGGWPDARFGLQGHIFNQNTLASQWASMAGGEPALREWGAWTPSSSHPPWTRARTLGVCVCVCVWVCLCVFEVN